MVRAPCCEKMGLKKGPWTPDEDHILISYIQNNGHGNWRALPKQAGLLRCGKSCRLRWTNYLRPDIKRGNFSNEEEETIIKLHEMLGNRWSAIAARLPGRTDNEIKNVWHTHLKKRLKNNQTTQDTKRHYCTIKPKIDPKASSISAEPINSNFGAQSNSPVSPQQSSASTDLSSVTDSSTAAIRVAANDMFIKQEQVDSMDYLPQIDESFWSEELSSDNSDFSGVTDDFQFQFESHQSGHDVTNKSEHLDVCSPSVGGNTDFWYNLLITAGELPEF